MAWFSISTELWKLAEDLEYQLENKIYSVDEIAARFHHKLVFIHPFVNGNGRHARLMADIVLLSQHQERFSWGSVENFSEPSMARAAYISALRAADNMNYQPLIDFVRQ